MPTPPISGQIILRSLTEQNGLQESTRDFSTLEELFKLVLTTQPPYLVDRISITGLDDNAHQRIINFVFRSVQIFDKP